MLVAVTTFAVAATLIILLPGPDTLVVVRGIVRGGRARGISTAAGNLVGLTVWVAAAALGLAALLRASHVAYDVLRVAGGAYLIWLGIQSLRAHRIARQADGRGGLVGTGFLAGLVTNLANPKVGVFFVTFLPGFVPNGYSVAGTSLLFGAIFIAETAAYWVLLLGLAGRVSRWMNNPRTRRRLDTVTGGVLIAFGLRLATES